MDAFSNSQQGPAIPTQIWEKGGLTEHLGGIDATQRLLRQCPLTPGLQVLDTGCGTGYTGVHLVQSYGAQVTALDLNPRSVEEAWKRVSKEGLERQITVLQADAHELPFPANTFDLAILESVLVFCDAATAAPEIHRILKPGGFLGANELTFLKPPPLELTTLLAGALGMHVYPQAEWEEILKKAGLAGITSSIYRIRLREQMRSHIRVDGIASYLTGVVAGLRDTAIRRTFFNREMLSAFRQFLPYVGYGLYVAEKAA